MRVAPRPPGGAIARPAFFVLLLGLLLGLPGAVGWQVDQRFHDKLHDRLDPALEGAELWVRGTVSSLPGERSDYTRFIFRPVARQAELAGLPQRIEVRWYLGDLTSRPRIEPGQAWRLKLRLRSPKGLLNFQGHDRERALFASGTGALATVLAGQRLPPWNDRGGTIDCVRHAVRGSIQDMLPAGPARGLILSLAIADRSELGRDSWAVLRRTGTGHLLAISGLHVGLAAMAGFWLTRLLLLALGSQPGLNGGRASFLACCVGSMVTALVYGGLAGFPVSTLRALVMLAAAMWLIAGRRSAGPFRAWMVAVAGVLAIDPLAPLTAGFWLSFGAVLALIAYFAPRGRPRRRWESLPRAQVAVMVVMLPLGALWFQAGSWMAFPSNLVAIPWVSLVTVPLVFLGLLNLGLSSLGIPAPATALFELAAWSSEVLHGLLGAMAGLESELAGGQGWMTPHVGAVTALPGLLGAMLLLGPRGLPARWLGLCLLAVVLLPHSSGLAEGEYAVEILDVGQGQAVVVRTRGHALLYDTGPGAGPGDEDHWSLFESAVSPALAVDGTPRPDLVVVSHADLDHAGGLQDLLEAQENVPLRFNQPRDDGGGCHSGQSWAWDGVRFTVLHPTPWLPYLGNDSSCVISIDNGRHRTLLTGDIGSVIEQRLLTTLDSHHLVTVPHHGSGSSSSEAFVRIVQPTWAVVSSAWGNRFGFPRPEVVERYRRHGTQLLSTADCGALRAHFPRSGEPRLVTARAKRARPWRWHSPNGCAPRTREDKA
ncbi:MAG: DNA internalization-related competence protein ComEC/Rec2 [Xanthomonadales bacterium]|nr:DNA internalization-related competence protein ComEC/Rec2 [Xanthomonadales bacterium]